MRFILFFSVFFLFPLTSVAKDVIDTVYTRNHDKVILNYNVSNVGDKITIQISKARIIPTESLRESCKYDLKRLKVVLFDRIGSSGNVKWEGITPTAFIIPPGMSYDRSEDGYYIFDDYGSGPLVFKTDGTEAQEIKFPLYIALYNKKRSYKILEPISQPLIVSIGGKGLQTSQSDIETERIAIYSSEEIEQDYRDITRALSSIKMVRQLLESETELPFSQTLIMEVSNLRSLQDRIKDPDVLSKFEDVFLELNSKERELKDAQKAETLSAQAQAQALVEQQKIDEKNKLKEAKEEARIQEEKQQKRTFGLIIGGVILAIFGFIGNAVFKHYRDISNQKSIMQMQESLARQARHEAGRRSREIVRNKAHQAANKSKNKLRESFHETGKSLNKSKIKSI